MHNLTFAQNNQLLAAKFSADLFPRFIAYIDAKPKTIETYNRSIRRFFVFMQENEISNPTRQDILAYRDALRIRCKPSTVQSYVIALRQFFKWAEQEGFYKNVANNIKGAKLNRSHKKDALNAVQVKV